MKNKDLNVFRLLRIAHNKRIKNVAEELSITPAYIHAIESGKNYPSGRLLRDYAKVMGVSEDIISNFKPEENTEELAFEKNLMRLLQIICNNNDS